MQVKECHLLPQSTVDAILSDVTDLCSNTTQMIGQRVFSLLQTAGIDPANIAGLSDLFSENSMFARPFIGLEMHYHQLSHYRAHLNFVVCL